MDAWPTFWDHNRPLYDEMIAAGHLFIRNERTAHFVNADGEYQPFPVGYITGPGCVDNGNPQPWYVSVYNGESWVQHSAETREKAVRWGLHMAEYVTTGNWRE